MAKTSNYIPMDSPIDRMNPMVKIYAVSYTHLDVYKRQVPSEEKQIW